MATTGTVLEQTTAVLRAAGASFAYLHGSRARGDARPGSDTDVAAFWTGGPPSAFDVPVPAGVDLMVLNSAPLELRGRVAAEGTLLLEVDPAVRIVWEATTRKIWFDERPRFEQAHREFAAAPGGAVTPVVDSVRVLRLLRVMTDEVSVLERERGATDGRRADPLWLRGVKYSFVVAIEAAVDVAQHLCAGGGWGPPADNGHAVRLLAEHGVVPVDLAGQVSSAVGFRNVLVHDYAVVDDTVVVARLDDLTDLTSFARSVARWVAPPG